MKPIAIVFSVLLFASSASAAGIYVDRTTTGTNSGAANVPTTLWSTSLPASAITADQAMLIHVSGSGLSTSTSATLDVRLNGISLAQIAVVGGYFYDLDIRVVRDSATQAWVSATVSYPTVVSSEVLQTKYVPAGLAWSLAQTLSVVGTSNVAGGVRLEHAGTQR